MELVETFYRYQPACGVAYTLHIQGKFLTMTPREQMAALGIDEKNLQRIIEIIKSNHPPELILCVYNRIFRLTTLWKSIDHLTYEQIISCTSYSNPNRKLTELTEKACPGSMSLHDRTCHHGKRKGKLVIASGSWQHDMYGM